jgi:nucleosome assembly protein 1-like 1
LGFQLILFLGDAEDENESFFTFFNTVTGKETGLKDNKGEILGMEDNDDNDFQLEFHFELGEELKEGLIPYALYWYTGEAELDESDDEDDTDEDDEGEDGDDEESKDDNNDDDDEDESSS